MFSPLHTPITPDLPLTAFGYLILNPQIGKSPVCVLHEYVQHVLKIAPEYVYRELENPQEPYSCTVVLKGVEYGTGTGSSKKTAKLQAAKATMKVLIPHLYQKVSSKGMRLYFAVSTPRDFAVCANASCLSRDESKV